MVWTEVKKVGDTLALMDDTVLSYGPKGWEPPRPSGTAGPYEVCGFNGGHVAYTGSGGPAGVFPFQENTSKAGVSLIAMANPE